MARHEPLSHHITKHAVTEISDTTTQQFINKESPRISSIRKLPSLSFQRLSPSVSPPPKSPKRKIWQITSLEPSTDRKAQPPTDYPTPPNRWIVSDTRWKGLFPAENFSSTPVASRKQAPKIMNYKDLVGDPDSKAASRIDLTEAPEEPLFVGSETPPGGADRKGKRKASPAPSEAASTSSGRAKKLRSDNNIKRESIPSPTISQWQDARSFHNGPTKTLLTPPTITDEEPPIAAQHAFIAESSTLIQEFTAQLKAFRTLHPKNVQRFNALTDRFARIEGSHTVLRSENEALALKNEKLTKLVQRAEQKNEKLEWRVNNMEKKFKEEIELLRAEIAMGAAKNPAIGRSGAVLPALSSTIAPSPSGQRLSRVPTTTSTRSGTLSAEPITAASGRKLPRSFVRNHEGGTQ